MTRASFLLLVCVALAWFAPGCKKEDGTTTPNAARAAKMKAGAVRHTDCRWGDLKLYDVTLENPDREHGHVSYTVVCQGKVWRCRQTDDAVPITECQKLQDRPTAEKL